MREKQTQIKTYLSSYRSCGPAGLCPPCSQLCPISLPHPSYFCPASLSACRVWGSAPCPAEPAKPLERQGSQAVPLSPRRAKRGPAGTPGGSRDPGDLRGSPAPRGAAERRQPGAAALEPPSGEGAPTYSIPRAAAAPAFLPEEKEGEPRTFFSLGWMKSQGEAFSISVSF